MDTATGELSSTVEQVPKKTDKSTKPNTQEVKWKVAEKLALLLKENATEWVGFADYTIDAQNTTLFSSFWFKDCAIRFLPFWGSCFIVLDDREFKVWIPNNIWKFSEYLERIAIFASKYSSLRRVSTSSAGLEDKENTPQHKWQTPTYKPLPKLSDRESLVIQFQNEMREFLTLPETCNNQE